MKQLYSTTLLLLLTCSYCLAQQDFRPGYIVLQGDTVQGLVDYRGATRSASTVNFKSAPGAAVQQYSPAQLAAYGFNQEHKLYEARVVPAADSAGTPERLFLSTLLKGKASLYYYRDKNQKDHYYLQQDESDLQVLKQQEFHTHDAASSKDFKGTSKLYIGMLASAFSDCGTIAYQELEKLKLSPKPLIDITRKYNACVAPKSLAFEQEVKQGQVHLGATVTYFNPALRFEGGTYLANASFSTEGATAGGGLSFNATIPKINEKLSVQAELLYLPAKFAAYYEEDGDFTNNKVAYNILFDLAYLKLPLQLRYTYPRGQPQPFVNAGISMGYAIKSDNQVVRHNTFGDRTTTETTRALLPQNDGYRKLMEGITAGAGVTYPLGSHPLSLEVRYEVNNGLSAINSLRSSVNTLYVLLSCSF